MGEMRFRGGERVMLGKGEVLVCRDAVSRTRRTELRRLEEVLN